MNMKPAELKELEAIARRVAVDVARCPVGVRDGRCTQPRGHDGPHWWEEMADGKWRDAAAGAP